ncbi:unnamed protein product [marine sediment metagenome]|uniref:Uncharacterized protein n=1 Tax=marine sediment metagenome TaxID=412755 RepID=X1JM70_9ZZZZ
MESVMEDLAQDEQRAQVVQERRVVFQELRGRMDAQEAGLNSLRERVELSIAHAGNPGDPGNPGNAGDAVNAVNAVNPGNPGNPGVGGPAVSQAVPVVIVQQPGGGLAVKESDDLNELKTSVRVLEAELGFGTALSVSNREAIRTHLIENDLGFFESMPETFEERQQRMPMDGDAAFMIAQEALGRLDDGEINIWNYHEQLAWLVDATEEDMQELMLEAGSGEEEADEEEE